MDRLECSGIGTESQAGIRMTVVVWQMLYSLKVVRHVIMTAVCIRSVSYLFIFFHLPLSSTIKVKITYGKAQSPERRASLAIPPVDRPQPETSGRS